MAVLDPEKDAAVIAELKSKHGAIHQLTLGADSVVVRLPSRFEYRKWQAEMLDEKKRVDAAEGLLFPCIVWPDQAARDSMFMARPGLLTTFTSDLLELAGVAKETEKKAL